MSDEGKFLIFVLEHYRNKKGLSGAEVVALFDRHGLWDLARKSYFVWHIESPDNFVQEIDAYISNPAPTCSQPKEHLMKRSTERKTEGNP